MFSRIMQENALFSGNIYTAGKNSIRRWSQQISTLDARWDLRQAFVSACRNSTLLIPQ